ncbi:MAG: hypothetical protein WKG07_14625 [Hymenobacter sp.]
MRLRQQRNTVLHLLDEARAAYCASSANFPLRARAPASRRHRAARRPCSLALAHEVESSRYFIHPNTGART